MALGIHILCLALGSCLPSRPCPSDSPALFPTTACRTPCSPCTGNGSTCVWMLCPVQCLLRFCLYVLFPLSRLPSICTCSSMFTVSCLSLRTQCHHCALGSLPWPPVPSEIGCPSLAARLPWSALLCGSDSSLPCSGISQWSLHSTVISHRTTTLSVHFLTPRRSWELAVPLRHSRSLTTKWLGRCGHAPEAGPGQGAGVRTSLWQLRAGAGSLFPESRY